MPGRPDRSKCKRVDISSVSNQNGVSPLYMMLEIHHSGGEPLNYLSSSLLSFALTTIITVINSHIERHQSGCF